MNRETKNTHPNPPFKRIILQEGISKQKNIAKNKITKTDWGTVANWYDDVVNDDDSYQAKVILLI